jgi:hypothetical protein
LLPLESVWSGASSHDQRSLERMANQTLACAYYGANRALTSSQAHPMIDT